MAETGASIGKALPLAGNATPVQPGRASRIIRRLRCNHMRLATAWVNSASTTSAHSVAASHMQPEVLPMQEALDIQEEADTDKIEGPLD